MSKRQWPSILFIVAFVISLAHASIPHTHPELERYRRGSDAATRKHHHDHPTKEHSHSHGDSTHFQQKGHHHEGHHDSTPQSKENHEHDDSKPEFSHFSNADYLGNSTFKFTAKEKYLCDVAEHERLEIEIPLEFKRLLLFPRARDIPPDKHRSSQSLRAPPFFS